MVFQQIQGAIQLQWDCGLMQPYGSDKPSLIKPHPSAEKLTIALRAQGFRVPAQNIKLISKVLS
jgi:hypothetical protein